MAGNGMEVKQARTGGAWRRWLPLAIVALLTVIALSQGWHRYLDLDKLARHEAALSAYVDANLAASLAIFAAVYVAAVALSLPGAVILTVAGGFLFGWLVGGLVTVAAATIGASIIFLIARTAVGDALVRRAGSRLAAIGEGFRRDALSYLLFLRLAPVFPFWLVNLAPAVLGVPLGTFVLATFLGIIPGTFAFAVVGQGLGSVLDGHRAAYEACVADGGTPDACRVDLEPSALVTPDLFAALAALAVLALVPVVAKKVFGRRGDASG